MIISLRFDNKSRTPLDSILKSHVGGHTAWTSQLRTPECCSRVFQPCLNLDVGMSPVWWCIYLFLAILLEDLPTGTPNCITRCRSFSNRAMYVCVHTHTHFLWWCICVCVSRLVMSDSAIPWTGACQAPWNSLGKNTGVNCHSLLQTRNQTQIWCIAGIFFTIWATMEAPWWCTYVYIIISILLSSYCSLLLT